MFTAIFPGRQRRGEAVLKSLISAVAALAVFAVVPQGAFAAGDPPPPSSPQPKSGTKAKTKPKPKAKEKSNTLRDDQIYSLGYWQAKGGAWDTALATLRSAGNQADPRIQTMIGYSLRKLGRVDEALGYYLAALASDPGRTTTREYLGEAYLQLNRLEMAKEQLAEIARRRGSACEDYQLLANEIAKYERQAG
jgi:tetratricopeptide (TPR) repeat protein